MRDAVCTDSVTEIMSFTIQTAAVKPSGNGLHAAANAVNM